MTDMTNEITLGCIAKDLSTGFQGVVINKTYFLNGNIQYSLQPPVKEAGGDIPSAYAIDYHTVEYVSEGISAKVPIVTQFPEIELGNLVEDSVSGFRGVATMQTQYLNGCFAFHVVARMNGRGEVKEDWESANRLVVISDGVRGVESVSLNDGKPYGGPSVKIPRSVC